MNDNTINSGVTIGGEQGTILANRYRVVRQLGQGGMGSVWLAEDTQLDNRQVAIKMLPSILVSNRRAYKQLKSEALVSLKLTHPNIATVRAFEENGGNPFLVVDYIDGITLDDYLADNGKLGEEETIRLLDPIATALDYAHGEGIVHRDVKPGNIIIRKDGHPFVLDFGIAREIQETMTRVTGKLSSGTLMYMSPEQLNGDAPSAAQDVYSFAAMFYECLTGAPPFPRGNIEYQIMNKEPAPIGPQFMKCGQGVMAGLAKNPGDRPESCAAVLSRRACHVAVDSSSSQIIGAPTKKSGLYRVIDLANGSVEHLDDVPSDGWTDEYKTSKLVLRRIEPGTFMMGSPPDEDGRRGDEIQHRVTLTKPYYIGIFEVTQRQWELVMGLNPSYFKGPMRPVEQVSYDDIRGKVKGLNRLFNWLKSAPAEAESFLGRLRSKTGVSGLDLPTEAQWEYACRAGSTTACSWGNALNGNEANCNGNYPCGTTAKGLYKRETCDVGSYAPNEWGLYDMHGNVWEWCADWYGSYGGSATDPTGPSLGACRVGRGGGWFNDARYCRSAYRYRKEPGYRLDNLGFRVACSAGPYE